jgi:peroxiredoxin
VAGLRQNDVVTGMGGVPLADPDELTSWVRLGPAETPLPVQIRRGGRSEQVTLVPERDSTPPAPVTATGPGRKAPLPNGVLCDEETEKLQPGPGQPVVLFFWRRDCPSCLEALEPLALASLRLGAVPIALSEDPPEVVERFLAARQRTFFFPSLCNAGDTFRAYRAGAPTFVLVGANHRVLDRSDGFLPGQPIFSEE